MANWDQPIIITGCARSGTSMVAGVLNMCGAWMGKVTGPTQYNKRGQFENEIIRDRLTKPLLKSIGCDPMGQDPLPVISTRMYSLLHSHGEWWRGKVLSVLESQGYDGTPIWAFKGAKACLIWPLWNSAFPEARWVIVRRDDEKIVDSCMRTRFMRKRTTRESWQEWVDHHKQCFKTMQNSMMGRVWEIWPTLAVDNDPESAFKFMVCSLGLTWDDKVCHFVDPTLWGG